MKEQPLQQLWNRRAFENRPLQSLCGRNFRLLDAGCLNPGDGPDFRLGRLQLTDTATPIELRGDIELHVHEGHWQEHHHSADPAYNGVVLHVFLFPAAAPVRLHNGAEPLRFCLKPYVSPEELAPHKAEARLPCAPQLSWISEKVMHQQLERARREYFEEKTRALMPDWNPALPVTQAWQELLLLHLADGLGISRNRAAMRELVAHCLPELRHQPAAGEIYQQLQTQSGLFKSSGSSAMKRSEWDFSGARPGNKPPERIAQLARIWAQIPGISRRELLRQPDRVWEQLLAESGLSRKRRRLLYLIVWLPAVYLLGSVLQAGTLQSYAYQRWTQQQHSPEKHLQEPFTEAGFPARLINRHLGTVHQLRSYCRAGKCGQCDIGARLRIADLS